MARKYYSDDELRRILEERDWSEFEISESESENDDDLGDPDKIVLTHETDENSDDDISSAGEMFLSKAGMEWKSQPPAVSRLRQCNIVNECEGLKNARLLITSIKDLYTFKLYITENMLSEICTHTNQHGENATIKWNERGATEQRQWKNVEINELYAFIALLIASGRNRGRKLQITEMWCENELFKQPFFTAVMSRNRFKNLYRHFRFDDQSIRTERIAITKDKLQPIRNIYDHFVSNCIENYSPGLNLTVDERLATFRGKCAFRVYIKSKPGRYGITIWIASDSQNAYILNSQVYTGKIANQREVNQGQRIVLDLTRPYFGTWRGVTTDNFFTSIPLAEELFRNQLTITGTLRTNKREIPSAFLVNARRQEHSSLFQRK